MFVVQSSLILSSTLLLANSTFCKFCQPVCVVITCLREGNPEVALREMAWDENWETWDEKGEALLKQEFFSVNVHPNGAPVLGLVAEAWSQ